MMARRLRSRDDQGSALVETALILSLLLMIALGAFEYGMAFQSWFGVSAASREGARVGASVGPTVDADCRILESVAAALQSTSGNEVRTVTIFEHDPSTGLDGAFNAYRPFDASTDNPANLRCTSWFIMAGSSWAETGRDNEGADRDWLGVKVEFRHTWITGFLWWSGTVDWNNRSIMRMEPVNYS
jgi:hypothetical protein